MTRELQSMKNEKSGFPSATGDTAYFDENQDAPGIYDLVNLNVRLHESHILVHYFTLYCD